MPRMHRSRRKRLRKAGLILIAAGLLIFVLSMDAKLRPLIKSVAANQAQAISTRVINEAASKVLADSGTNYSQLMYIDKDTDGRVTSLSADIVKINSLKAALSTAIQEAIAKEEAREIKIPIGTLLGSDFLTGRGPSISVRLHLVGSVVTDIKNSFISAGINQTRHLISLNVTANIYVLVPGYKTSTAVNTNFTIAENIIVGLVPDAYTNVNKADSELVGDLFDFGAESSSASGG